MQATMTKTQNAQTSGQYRPTAIDAQKAAADFRITDCLGGKFTLRGAPQIDGRGITRICDGCYSVTEKALKKIERSFTVACDF